MFKLVYCNIPQIASGGFKTYSFGFTVGNDLYLIKKKTPRQLIRYLKVNKYIYLQQC